MEQVIIIGGGPCGLSAAVELKKVGMNPLIIEKGFLVNSIYNYPTYMIFHSTPELLEIGDIPFTTPNEKPTRVEALNYYRVVAERTNLRIQCYETVVSVEREESVFRLVTMDRFQMSHTYTCKHLIVATGYFDQPNRMNIPGEELPKVTSYYKEAHPYAGMKVAVVGGNNSAVDAALDLERVGADVSLICRGAELSGYVKAWVRPIFESMVKKGRIHAYFSANIKKIHERLIEVDVAGTSITLDNDFVLSLIGYHPDRSLLQSLGVSIDPKTGVPMHHPETMETDVSHLYLAGVIAAGNQGNAIFIENGRFHGRLIANHIHKNE